MGWDLLPTVKAHMWQASIWKAVSPGRLCNAQAVLKQIGIVGVSMTCVSEPIIPLTKSNRPVMRLVLWYLIEFKFIALQLTSPLGNCSSYIFYSGLAMERTSEFPQVCYYRYLGFCSIRHWHSKRGTSTWGILWYYGILYVVTAFYHSNRRLTILLGCWILPQFQAERIVTEYLWVWLAGLFMIIIYGIMLAIIHRWFNIAHGIHWLNQPARDALDVESDDKKIKSGC